MTVNTLNKGRIKFGILLESSRVHTVTPTG